MLVASHWGSDSQLVRGDSLLPSKDLGSDPPVASLALAGLAGMFRCQPSSSIALPSLHTLPGVGALCLHGASLCYSLLV